MKFGEREGVVVRQPLRHESLEGQSSDHRLGVGDVVGWRQQHEEIVLPDRAVRRISVDDDSNVVGLTQHAASPHTNVAVLGCYGQVQEFVVATKRDPDVG